MNNKSLIVILVVAVAVIMSFMFLQIDTNDDAVESTLKGENLVATIYKSPTCGCCGVFASYIKREGHDVETNNVLNMGIIKEQFGIPHELESCHTMEMDGYVIEGHVPEAAIQKLLTEKPDIAGIGMPGMPSGSPGMPGLKNGNFMIHEITNDGTKGDLFMKI